MCAFEQSLLLHLHMIREMTAISSFGFVFDCSTTVVH